MTSMDQLSSCHAFKMVDRNTEDEGGKEFNENDGKGGQHKKR